MSEDLSNQLNNYEYKLLLILFSLFSNNLTNFHFVSFSLKLKQTLGIFHQRSKSFVWFL